MRKLRTLNEIKHFCIENRESYDINAFFFQNFIYQIYRGSLKTSYQVLKRCKEKIRKYERDKEFWGRFSVEQQLAQKEVYKNSKLLFSFIVSKSG